LPETNPLISWHHRGTSAGSRGAGAPQKAVMQQKQKHQKLEIHAVVLVCV